MLYTYNLLKILLHHSSWYYIIAPTLYSTAYSSCHVALVIKPVSSILFCVLTISSNKDIPPYNDPKLVTNISLYLPLPLFLSNYRFLVATSKNADCFPEENTFFICLWYCHQSYILQHLHRFQVIFSLIYLLHQISQQYVQQICLTSYYNSN